MAFFIDLPEELEDELKAEADRQGVPLSELAVRVLSAWRAVESTSLYIPTDRSHIVTPDVSPARGATTTGKDLVAYWQREGLIGTRPDIVDSQDHARQIRAQAERPQRTAS